MIEDTLNRAFTIPGMMWPNELGWLYSVLAGSRNHVEIGTYCGKSLYTTARGMKGGSILCVDPLIDTPSGRDWHLKVLNATIDMIHNETDVEVTHMDDYSCEAYLNTEGMEFDSVFIDGDHHYPEVRADIDMWSERLRPGGLICGHDYWPKNPGVMDAVNELLPNHKKVRNMRIWYCYL